MLDQGPQSTRLPGEGAGPPSLVRSGRGRLDAFTVKDHIVWWAKHMHPETGSYPGWDARCYQLPGLRDDIANLPVSAASARPGEIDVYGVGRNRFDGLLLQWRLRNDRWTQERLDTSTRLACGPTAVSRVEGVMEIFGIQRDTGRLVRWTRVGEQWRFLGGPEPLPGGVRLLPRPPAVAVRPSGRLDLFALSNTDDRQRVMHWWSDEEPVIHGPEMLPPVARLSDTSLAARWNGPRLDLVAVIEGGLLHPRGLAHWRQVEGSAAWAPRVLRRARGFSSPDTADVWLEATAPAVLPSPDRFSAVAVSALRNAREYHSFTRNLVVWDGDDSVRRLGREGASDRGLAVCATGTGVDALVDVGDDVLHLWSGHHGGALRPQAPEDLVATRTGAGLRVNWRTVPPPRWSAGLRYVVRSFSARNHTDADYVDDPGVDIGGTIAVPVRTGRYVEAPPPPPPPRTPGGRTDPYPSTPRLVPEYRIEHHPVVRVSVVAQARHPTAVTRWTGTEWADSVAREVTIR